MPRGHQISTKFSVQGFGFSGTDGFLGIGDRVGNEILIFFSELMIHFFQYNCEDLILILNFTKEASMSCRFRGKPTSNNTKNSK